MMNAKEAANKVDNAYLDITNTTLKSELALIEKELDAIIKSGTNKKCITVYRISEVTKKHLQSLGYTVKYEGGGAFRGEDYYTITF